MGHGRKRGLARPPDHGFTRAEAASGIRDEGGKERKSRVQNNILADGGGAVERSHLGLTSEGEEAVEEAEEGGRERVQQDTTIAGRGRSKNREGGGTMRVRALGGEVRVITASNRLIGQLTAMYLLLFSSFSPSTRRRSTPFIVLFCFPYVIARIRHRRLPFTHYLPTLSVLLHT